MKALKATLLASAAVLALTAPSFADVAPGGTVGYSGPTDYSMRLGEIAKFNGNAGTLTSVVINYGYGFNSSITVSATTTSNGTVRTESGADFQSSDTAIQNILNNVVNTNADGVSFGASTLAPVAYDLLGNRSSYSLTPTLANPTPSMNYTSSASASNTVTLTGNSVNAFIAGANSAVFDVYGATLTGLVTSQSGGNASVTQQTIASQTFSVTYNYTPSNPPSDVPEPASFALLGAGLVGLGLIRRKAA